MLLLLLFIFADAIAIFLSPLSGDRLVPTARQANLKIFYIFLEIFQQ
ncbi:MAG TPA: hypothetical protein V6D12_01915 [Candidatus Obscuribacterales bacterium]